MDSEQFPIIDPHHHLWYRPGHRYVLDDLIADRKYQFVFIFTPAPIKGATDSNGCPTAVT